RDSTSDELQLASLRGSAPKITGGPKNGVEQKRAAGVDQYIVEAAGATGEHALVPLVETSDEKGEEYGERRGGKHEPAADDLQIDPYRTVPRLAQQQAERSIACEVAELADEMMHHSEGHRFPLREHPRPE